MCEASRTALVASWHLPRVHGFPCRASPADTPGSATYDPRPSLPAREWRGIGNARDAAMQGWDRCEGLALVVANRASRGLHGLRPRLWQYASLYADEPSFHTT